MRSAEESLKEIQRDLKALAALECTESALSTNKPYVGAQAGKTGKRGPSSHIPIDGRHPETVKSLVVKKLDAMATVIKRERMFAEGGEQAKVWEAIRKAVLADRGSSPVELAYLYGYSSDKSVRELRIRHGQNENTGYKLTSSEQPIVSPYARRQR